MQKLSLIDDVRQVWKYLSVQVALLGAGIEGTVWFFPQVRGWLSDGTANLLGALLFLAVIAGRVVRQGAPVVPPGGGFQP
jgi:hypothetical protein